ncbi:MAG: hypothetical protein JXA18_01060 [Chitinispirillaceae bacterium]|nr:hypothetical protein [Chitinispirillaceae bacterium]
MQVSLESIGLTSLFGIPWAVKFLWAPQIDRFGTRRRWMLLMQSFLALLFITVGLCTPLAGGVAIIAALLLAGAFLAATHDVAIDGYYLVTLDSNEQAAYVGYRVMAYRIAMMAGTGLVATIGTTIGWIEAFVAAGGLLLLLAAYHCLFLPRSETQQLPLSAAVLPLRRPRFLIGASVGAGAFFPVYAIVNSRYYGSILKNTPFLRGLGFAGWISIVLLLTLIVVAMFRRRIVPLLYRRPDSFYARAFMSFMDREHIGSILAFIILLRTGEFLLSNMVSPFMVDAGMKVHYGWMQALLGLPASIAGAMLGGVLISRLTLQRVLFPFLLAQNGSNLVYMLVAFSLQKFVVINTGAVIPEPVGTLNLIIVAAVQGFDQFSGGLGTAVLMTFLMRICRGEFTAAHYAIGSGLMSISGVFAGAASGFLAARLGYGRFFGLSFILSLPGMVLAFPAMKALIPAKNKKALP